FSEFLEFDRRVVEPQSSNINGGSPSEISNQDMNPLEGLTPEEALQMSYQSLRQALAQEILQKVKEMSPRFFETLVVDVLVSMGYGGSRKDAGQVIGKSGDEGIDGIIKEDKLWLDLIYIQAKRWQNPVGRPEVQAFAGSLEGFRAKKGIFITTSRFTQEAKDYVERISARIILLNGEELAQLMIDHNVGTSEYERYIIKKIDLDYFSEE
ncbi:MAG: restriction endonuclease, partial [Cyanobacteria bacterium]|nr:restriction endonuclease [Cyanobacteriota bacterium]